MDEPSNPAVPDSGELASGVRFEREADGDGFVLVSDAAPLHRLHLGPWTTVEQRVDGGYYLLSGTPPAADQDRA